MNSNSILSFWISYMSEASKVSLGILYGSFPFRFSSITTILFRRFIISSRKNSYRSACISRTIAKKPPYHALVCSAADKLNRHFPSTVRSLGVVNILIYSPFPLLLSIVSITFLIYFRSIYLKHTI